MIVKNNSNKRSQTIVSNVDQKIRASIQEMWVALPDDATYEDLRHQNTKSIDIRKKILIFEALFILSVGMIWKWIMSDC